MMARLGPKGSAFCSVAVGSKFYYDTLEDFQFLETVQSLCSAKDNNHPLYAEFDEVLI